MTVPPPVIAANRSLLMALVATNFLGQNTAAIAATEAQYMRNVGAGRCRDAMATPASPLLASTLTPFTPAPNTTNPAGLAGQTAAVAQTTGTSAGTGAQTIASMGPAAALYRSTAALQGLAQPLQSTSGLSGILDDLGFTSLQSYLELGRPSRAVYREPGDRQPGHRGNALCSVVARGGCCGLRSGGRSELGPRRAGVGWSGGPGRAGGDREHGSGAVSVGRLSAPPGWAVAAPEFRTIARTLPITGANAPPAVLTGSSGTLFSEMALAGMAGRAMGGTEWPRPPAVRRGC